MLSRGGPDDFSSNQSVDSPSTLILLSNGFDDHWLDWLEIQFHLIDSSNRYRKNVRANVSIHETVSLHRNSILVRYQIVITLERIFLFYVITMSIFEIALVMMYIHVTIIL